MRRLPVKIIQYDPDLNGIFYVSKFVDGELKVDGLEQLATPLPDDLKDKIFGQYPTVRRRGVQ